MKIPNKVLGPQIQKLMEMPVTARLVLGECRMEIEEILRLGQGSMLVLDTNVKENLKLYINDEEIAKAKSVIVGDKLGAQIMEISSTEKRLKDLTDLE
ncbi:MAG: FliM/FliN family flagellar motor switch protein [SAR324 cluster bacterium]|nr:FliM/FliN family flagellar motor switch protein [SAR324 cluster bacterium]